MTAHFNTTDLNAVLGVDFRGVGQRFRSVKRTIPEQCACVDEWGTGYIMKEYPGGTYPEAFHQPLARLSSLDDVEAYAWPKADDYDFSDLPEQCDAVCEYAVCLGGAGIPDIVNGVGRGRGMEQVLLDIMNQDEVGIEVIDKR